MLLCLTFVHLHLSLQRADEVNKVDPKVAYYCRMYAIEQVRSLTIQVAGFGDTCAKKGPVRDTVRIWYECKMPTSQKQLIWRSFLRVWHWRIAVLRSTVSFRLC